MSNVLEFHGKNVEQALEKASAALQLPVERIKHEVVAYGSSGIFGLVGIKKAKIQVFVGEEGQPGQPPPSVDRPEGVVGAAAAEQADAFRAADDPCEGLEAATVASGSQTLQRILDKITEGAAVSARAEGGEVVFSVTGGDRQTIIGSRGQTLEALQYLLEKIINRKNDNRTRVLVDVDGYLEKRKNHIQQLASRMAEKAKRMRKPVTIGQMNAHERRIVHLHLKEESGIRTQSVGEGYYRKLIIFPKKQAVKENSSPEETP